MRGHRLHGSENPLRLSRARVRPELRRGHHQWPLAGVTARAVLVVGKDGTLKHLEYVPEISSEPNYTAALAAARAAM